MFSHKITLMMKKLKQSTHKRYNILTGEWVLVSPHRTKRPWLGHEEENRPVTRPSYDPACYLCHGNIRANGEKNPDYTNTFVFENDFAALKSTGEPYVLHNGLLKAETETGICKVVCFSPDHSKSLADLPLHSIEQVISVWQQEYKNLGARPDINYVQIFENKGAVMGASNPHPHGQIWAQHSLPNEVIKKDKTQKDYFSVSGKSLLQDYIHQELTQKERIIFENDDFVCLVPFWAVWPFETMIVPKQHQNHIGQMSVSQKYQFAQALKRLAAAYDNIFNVSFPYSSGIHQAPTNGADNTHWHWHMSFYPPLLRSATVKKFMVGYEMFAMPQRDITAETAAVQIRNHLTQINDL